jgi:hypothetical protein
MERALDPIAVIAASRFLRARRPFFAVRGAAADIAGDLTHGEPARPKQRQIGAIN